VLPHLSPETASRVTIVGKDYEEDLFRLVDPANVPRELGGTCECEGGCTRADSGPWTEEIGKLAMAARQQDNRDIQQIS
jgi:hypothetical protein